MFGLRFPGVYLPWVLVAFSVLMGSVQLGLGLGLWVEVKLAQKVKLALMFNYDQRPATPEMMLSAPLYSLYPVPAVHAQWHLHTLGESCMIRVRVPA